MTDICSAFFIFLFAFCVLRSLHNFFRSDIGREVGAGIVRKLLK